MPNLTAELALATDLARKAGAAILAVKSEARAEARMKADDSPVTKADLAADAIIRAGLAPFVARGDVVVTEETFPIGSAGDVGVAQLPAGGRAWFIDPLDGTEDFVAGRPDYVVQIGLCIDRKPVLGVLFAPESGVVWRGLVDDALCERIDASGAIVRRDVRARALGASPRIAISVSHPSETVEAVVKQLGASALRVGSVGLKVGAIVDDEADAYITASRRIKVWDTCAPAAVLLAAGGVVTTLDGDALAFSGTAAHPAGVCMWTPAAKSALFERVQDGVRRFRAASGDTKRA